MENDFVLGVSLGMAISVLLAIVFNLVIYDAAERQCLATYEQCEVGPRYVGSGLAK